MRLLVLSLMSLSLMAQTTIRLNQLVSVPGTDPHYEAIVEAAWCKPPVFKVQEDKAVLRIGPDWGLGDKACRLRLLNSFSTFMKPIDLIIKDGIPFGGEVQIWLTKSGVATDVVAVQTTDAIYERLEVPLDTGTRLIRVGEDISEPQSSWVLCGMAYIMSAEWTDTWGVLGFHQVSARTPEEISISAVGSDLILSTEGTEYPDLLRRILELESRIEALEQAGGGTP